jgi:hypothetical protein
MHGGKFCALWEKIGGDSGIWTGLVASLHSRYALMGVIDKQLVAKALQVRLKISCLSRNTWNLYAWRSDQRSPSRPIRQFVSTILLRFWDLFFYWLTIWIASYRIERSLIIGVVLLL